MQASFWDDKRPPGVISDIDFDQHKNIVELLEKSFVENADRPCFTGIKHTLTYADIDHYSCQLAAYLTQVIGLKPGDRIAIQMPNILQYPIAVYAALRAGLVVVNTNPLYTAREMQHQFNDSGAKALIFVDLFGHLVEEVVEDTPIEHLIQTSMGDMLPPFKRFMINQVMLKWVKKLVKPFHLPQAVAYRQALELGALHSQGFVSHQAELEDVAFLQYTGGTTGVSKGAMLTHRNLIANMLQMQSAIAQIDEQGTRFYEQGKEVIVAPLPLYHIYSFTINGMAAVIDGNHNILIANPRDAKTFIMAIKDAGITCFTGINTLFTQLMEHPDIHKVDFSQMRLSMSGGTALAQDTGQRWEALTGSMILEGYGLTECSPIVSSSPGFSWRKPGSVGLPLPGTSVKLVDDSGNEVDIGESGEICVQGPQVMKGYWKRPEATADAFTADGYFKTGDVGQLDEAGYLKIVDRIKDMILVSGFNVYPNEIEDVVAAHPKVANCAVVGVKHAKTGEAPKLFVVPTDTELTKDEITAYCRANLTGYKIPKEIEFRESLPMTPVGKILRRELREANN